MLLLIWIVKRDPPLLIFAKRSISLTPASLLALISLLSIPIYTLFYLKIRPTLGWLPPIAINKISFQTLALILSFGLMSLVALVFYDSFRRASHILGILLSIVILIQIGVLLRYGTFVVPVRDRPTFEQMKTEKKEKLDYRHHDLPGMQTAAVITQLDHSFIEPFLGKIFTQIIPVEIRDDAYSRMERKRLPQQLFIEGYDSAKAEAMTEGARDMEEGSIKLVYSSFNRMQFHVNSQMPAFFSFSYPYTNHWRAWVNGESTEVYRANGAAHAVEIPKGKSLIDFRYWSNAFFWGVFISCFTFAVICLFVCVHALKGLPRVAGIILVLLISVGGFLIWYNSFYNGDNLETEYTWTYTPPFKIPNLAYGKKTSGFELPSTSYLQYHRSRAVDGDTRPESGFTFEAADEKELIVDLNQDEAIKKIILFGKSDSNPLITLSQDGEQWYKTKSFILRTESPLNFFQVNFEKPVSTRYVKVKATDSRLSIYELEVYGAEQN
jgi:hypothetical protein